MTLKYLAILLLFAVFRITGVFSQHNEQNLIQFIKPEIGLDNGGNVIPGPSLPFGLVKLGPDCEGGSNSGYISGETLQSVDSPGEIVVISTWQTVDDWQRWVNHKERLKIQDQIDMLLGKKTEYKVYQYG